eukprot:TRINITY_DN93547_c0_g1_i1.p4 TRINITY_DN93547_c0_g1~~TRINITY_DN93547_c0_g1_i1.p4  ORF type:complete len:145 (+),score=22.77 TRINITY_DN93547_c0_g1_i1:2-436(+)
MCIATDTCSTMRFFGEMLEAEQEIDNDEFLDDEVLEDPSQINMLQYDTELTNDASDDNIDENEYNNAENISQCLENVSHVLCTWHVLQLIVKDGLNGTFLKPMQVLQRLVVVKTKFEIKIAMASNNFKYQMEQFVHLVGKNFKN